MSLSETQPPGQVWDPEGHTGAAASMPASRPVSAVRSRARSTVAPSGRTVEASLPLAPPVPASYGKVPRADVHAPPKPANRKATRTLRLPNRNLTIEHALAVIHRQTADF